MPGNLTGFHFARPQHRSLDKDRYRIALADTTVGTAADTADDCNGKKSRKGYYATAVPINFGTTGQRGFSTAALASIFFTNDGTAPAETGGTPIQ